MSRSPLHAVTARVSRSFSLSLRFLPKASREPISTAYLLARAADTLADTDALPGADRRAELAELEALAALVASDGSTAPARDRAAALAARAVGPTMIPEERELLERLGEVLDAFGALDAGDRRRTVEVLSVIVSGQHLDLARFPTSAPPRAGRPTPIHALQSRDDLDDYCYRVAGVVGAYWTATQLAHGLRLPARWRGRRAELRDLAVRFGKGLQMVNVLRDVPADLGRGRCYIPEDDLAAHGLDADALRSRHEARRAILPLYDELLDVAVGHVRAGFDYIDALPLGAPRLRAVCALPLAIAAATLGLLRRARNPLDPSSPRKITRRRVKSLLVGALLRSPTTALGPWLRQIDARSGMG